MRKTFQLLTVSVLILGACGLRDSRVNPFNWFGTARSAPVAESTAPVNPLIPTSTGLFSSARSRVVVYDGRPFEQITDLTVERVPGGAIIRATGLAARQGYYDVQLTPATEGETPDAGVLTYRLEGRRPERRARVGTAPSREVIAARRVTDQTLRGVREIRVEGTINALVSRR